MTSASSTDSLNCDDHQLAQGAAELLMHDLNKGDFTMFIKLLLLQDIRQFLKHLLECNRQECAHTRTQFVSTVAIHALEVFVAWDTLETLRQGGSPIAR